MWLCVVVWGVCVWGGVWGTSKMQNSANNTPFKVGVNHGIFHVYHFWNFLIFKCTWVCSSSSSKNKNIFLNLSINSINLKMSIYLSISKMCSSLFSRGNQACARIANAKRTTQSRDAALSAITDIDYSISHPCLCTMCRPTCIRVSLFGKLWPKTAGKTGPKSDFIRGFIR